MGHFDVEYGKIFPVLYVLIFPFHLDLNHQKILFQGSYGHSLEQLCNIWYLLRYVFKYREKKLLLLLLLLSSYYYYYYYYYYYLYYNYCY